MRSYGCKTNLSQRRTRRWLGFVVIFLCSLASLAQNAPNASWQRVQALSPASRIRVASDTKSASCFVITVSDSELTCSRSPTATGHPLVFPRSEVKNIKFSRKGHSATVGLLIGMGAGAGIGAGLGIAENSGAKGTYLHVSSDGKPAAVGAVLGALILGSTGAAIGYSNDLFAGPLIYRR